MPLNLGPGIEHGADELSKGFAVAFAHMNKQKGEAEQTKALLDMARLMTIPDPKTGEPKPVFADKHLSYIQGLYDSKKYHAAAAAESAMGIGKDMMVRYQSAAAKQQAEYEKQKLLQQSMQQGPVLTTVPGHGNYRWTGKEYVPDTAVPRNQMGLNAEDQLNMQRKVNKDVNQAQTAQFKAQEQAKLSQTKIFSAFLKSNGIKSPTDLFDPSIMQGGTFDPTSGFKEQPADVPHTHINFYHKPAEGDTEEKPGVTLPTSQVMDMQNAAAAMAGPQAMQALQWLRQNPSSEHAAAVAKEISNRMGQIDQAPQPAAFNPSPPSFAPEQAPAAAFQQGSQPVAGPVTDESQVSQDAADQNPGY